MNRVDVSYQIIVTQNVDEADSLAAYLNEHGIFSIAIGDHEVRVASADLESDELIRTLKVTWRQFWENSDSGLLGLPMFMKES